MKVYQYKFSGPGDIMNGNVAGQGIFDLLSKPKKQCYSAMSALAPKKNFGDPCDIPAPPTTPEMKKISEMLGQDLGSMSGFGKKNFACWTKDGKKIHKKDFRPMNLDENGGDGKDPVQAEQKLTKLAEDISNHSANFSVGHQFVQMLFMKTAQGIQDNVTVNRAIGDRNNAVTSNQIYKAETLNRDMENDPNASIKYRMALEKLNPNQKADLARNNPALYRNMIKTAFRSPEGYDSKQGMTSAQINQGQNLKTRG